MKQFHLGSFCFGFVTSLALLTGLVGGAGYALAGFDLGNFANTAKLIAKSATNLVQVKQNLDKDVANLTADAKNMIGDKENLLSIKEQLTGLANKTREQIDGISKLVGVVEGHLKSTQENISATAKHVSGVDAVRKDLSEIK